MSILAKLDTAAGDETGPRMPTPTDRPADPRWGQWVDLTLIDWGRTPAPVPDEDDGFLMPGRAAVDTACAVARQFAEQGLPAPDDVVANGDGGIFFHWGTPGESFETFEFVRDGSGTYTHTEHLRRVTHKPFTRDVLRESIYG